MSVSQVSLTHKNMTIDIKPPEEEKKETREALSSRINRWQSQDQGLFFEDQDAEEASQDEQTTIGEVVQALNAMGVKPPDMISILQAIKRTGAIQAEIEII